MKIAAIIPTRNMAATLGRAIRSAASAGIDEIVVIDDASEDNTTYVLREFGDRVTVWRWPRKSRDHMTAQRVAWESTDADFFVGMGADDIVLPDLVPAIRRNENAPVVFTDYAVVKPESYEILWTVSQEVSEQTILAPEAMQARITSDRNATETGIGSAIRREVMEWLWETNFSVMGPHADSIGYATAAALYGCVLEPVVGAAYTFTDQSYARDSSLTPADHVRRAVACAEWMQSVGLELPVAKALIRKRCGVEWK